MLWTLGLLAGFQVYWHAIFLSVELTVAAAGIYIPLGLVTAALIGTNAVGSIALGGALALPLAVTSALCVTAQLFDLPGLCVSELIGISADPVAAVVALAFAALGAAFGILSLSALFG